MRRDADFNYRRLSNKRIVDVAWIYNHMVALSYIIMRDVFSETQLVERDLYIPLENNSDPDSLEILKKIQ